MMSTSIKLATWNLCLGLQNKKDYVNHKLNQENIDICCLQECEIPNGLEDKHLTLRDYKIELEDNQRKKRTGILIHNSINYERKRNLEEINTNLVIIDINGDIEYRVVNIYRSFAPERDATPTDNFINQLRLINNAITDSPNRTHIIMGDFNLDFNKIYINSYPFSHLFNHLLATFDPLGLQQLVNFETWHRFVNGEKRFSIIDHIYTDHPEQISNLMSTLTDIGDHMLISCEIVASKSPKKVIMKRDWRNYSKDKLIMKLKILSTLPRTNCVQETWNKFENILINIVDDIVPLVPFVDNSIKEKLSPKLKNLLNQKKRLLKKRNHITFNGHLALKAISKNIRSQIKYDKIQNVRRGIIPGNSKSLWHAVKKSKDINLTNLPDTLTLNGQKINEIDLPDAFAEFFSKKVKTIVNDCVVDDSVYNGSKKLDANSINFMTSENVSAAIKSLKAKNCEGFDRIPVRIITDGITELTPILTHLFNLIYSQKRIPDQWKVSKVIPLYKKGTPNKIENYRPIANLCSTSKVFEKLILMRLNELEIVNNISLTGKPQHGFKKGHSTASLGLLIQSLLSNALDQNQYALMASLDLSAAFDVVNIGLLIKRLDIVGIPADVVSLIGTWLSERIFYVSVDGDNSYFIAMNTGILQGSILGPILYAIFVAPLFDLEKLSNYADDNFIIRWNSSIEELIIDMQRSLEAITKWLRESGLMVNEAKTEMCLFHRSSVKIINITVNNFIIRSTPQINVLGVTFDSKLQWTEQVANSIKKANKSLLAIKLISKFFNQTEIKTLLTSNFYSVLYYNSEIWHLPKLAPYLKTLLMSASANALKLCTPSYTQDMSFTTLHEINKRATPDQFCIYKQSLLLHTVYNFQTPKIEWLTLNFNQAFNQREGTFIAFDISNYKVGKTNSLANRLTCLNRKIPLDWLNHDKIKYKILCKQNLLPYVG